MFQLIVAVISIALVAALAIASIYYGGTAFSKSSLRANVVTLVNGGQQIAGAQALYRTDTGALAPTVADLQLSNGGVTYLTQAPGISPIATGSWSISLGAGANDPSYAVVSLSGNAAAIAEVTAEVNRQATGNTNTAGVQFFVDSGTFRFKL